MKVYTYDIWEGDKGIIFANSEEEAIKMYEQAYPDNPIMKLTLMTLIGKQSS